MKSKRKISFGLMGFVGFLSGCSSRALGVTPPVTTAFPSLESFLSESRRYSTPALLLKCFIVYDFSASWRKGSKCPVRPYPEMRQEPEPFAAAWSLDWKLRPRQQQTGALQLPPALQSPQDGQRHLPLLGHAEASPPAAEHRRWETGSSPLQLLSCTQSLSAS